MPKFSTLSASKLKTCDPRIILICDEAIKVIDFTVIYGHRNKVDQDAEVAAGHSKLTWPNSKHNVFPSRAVDLAPYPIDWSNETKALARFYYLGGIIKAIASEMGIKIRQGLDWDGDGDFKDQNFDDLGHFELVD